METVHHVHAEDVARLFISAMDCWSVAAGESFHAASDAALSLRGYAEAAYRWWGHEANIKYLPWKEWESCHTAEQVRRTWDHIAHSPCASMEKARRLLGFAPRWPSLDAVRESVGWLEKNGFQQP
jgi:nucleoside-diphosphate-sugar epimerase